MIDKLNRVQRDFPRTRVGTKHHGVARRQHADAVVNDGLGRVSGWCNRTNYPERGVLDQG
ncbi:hypothetical protein D3C76_1723550 [compost metagenome]